MISSLSPPLKDSPSLLGICMKGVSEYPASAILLVITVVGFGLVYTTLVSSYTDVVEKLS